MTILAELRAEVQTAWQRSPTQTVLWLDLEREWERLLDQLAAELEPVKYAGSQLELRVKIELEPAQQPRIVYVPLPRQSLSVLKEYEFTLPVWDEALLHALRRWGVGIERDEEKSLLPLLPGLAARWSDRPKDDWRQRSFWPASAGGWRAVLVLDAFRFDLARELEETLHGAGAQVTVELHALRAPLPSITPLGMASLLPLETIQVDVSDGTWAIRPGGADADAPELATKAGREQLLTSLLDG